MSAAAAGADPGAAGAAHERARQTELLARTVFAVLVLACIGAFFLTQHLKHTPTAVQEFRRTPFFEPSHPGPHEQEALSFKLEHADRVTVRVINSSGDTVATLVRDWPLERYRTFSLRWNGRRGTARRYERTRTETGLPILLALPSGPIAPAGEYRLEVSLRRQHKTVRSPWSFTLRSP